MTSLPHTHTNDPLSIPVCNGCISVIMSNLGKKGGAKTKQLGHDHFVAIGKKGGRPKKLVQSDIEDTVDKTKPTSL